MGDTCRAAVFLGDSTYEVREFPIPDPPAGGAVLKVEAVGLCGSDVAQFHGVELVPGSRFPVVPGHETVGRVAKLGAGANELGVIEGDRVAVNEIHSVHPTFVVYGYTEAADHGPGLWGGYGEYMVVLPGTQLVKLPEDVPAEELTVFEPLANGVNWVDVIGLQAGESVVVQGPGHQGLAVLEAVLVASPGVVVVTGSTGDELRLETAKRIGAFHGAEVHTADVSHTDPAVLVRSLTGGMGADVVFDVAPATATVNTSLDLVRFGGRVLLAGLKHFRPVEGFVSDRVVLSGLTVKGGSGFTPQSLLRAVELLSSGVIDTAAVRGEVFGLDGIEEAMQLLTRTHPSREAVRVSLRHS